MLFDDAGPATATWRRQLRLYGRLKTPDRGAALIAWFRTAFARHA